LFIPRIFLSAGDIAKIRSVYIESVLVKGDYTISSGPLLYSSTTCPFQNHMQIDADVLFSGNEFQNRHDRGRHFDIDHRPKLLWSRLGKKHHCILCASGGEPSSIRWSNKLGQRSQLFQFMGRI